MKLSVNTLTCVLMAAIMFARDAAFAQSNDPSQKLLSPTKLFYRCYSQLTGKRPAGDHPLLQQVRAGTLDPVDGCMQILSKAVLVPASESDLTPEQKAIIIPTDPEVTFVPYVVHDTNDEEAVAVLNRFHDLHRMFFEVKDFAGVPAFSWLVDRINDPTEAPVYLTRLAFMPGAQYREVVTGNYGVRRIGSLGPWVRTYFTGGSDRWQLNIPGSGLERGILWGVGAYAPGDGTWVTDDGNTANNFKVKYRSRFTTTRRSFGGGIMGLQSYVTQNSGFPGTGESDNPDLPDVRNNVSNASFRMHRRLVQNIYKDLLCRQIPVVRAQDVNNLVADYLQNFPEPATQIPFRTSGTCMQCHAAIDPMAAVFRSLVFTTTENTNWQTDEETHDGYSTAPTTNFMTTPAMWSTWAGFKPPETPAHGEYTNMPRDSLFFQRPARGDLRMRSYDGTLVWKSIPSTNDLEGIQNLGNAIAELDDLYACAASRYFNFFTGVKVTLSDIGDPQLPPLSRDDLYYRDIVVTLGKSLKQHQNLRQLVKEIMELPLYHKEGMRDLVQ